MPKVTIQSDLREQLSQYSEKVELCDEAGNTIGLFTPGERPRRRFTEIRKGYFPYTDEEVLELVKQKPGRPLREVVEEWRGGH